MSDFSLSSYKDVLKSDNFLIQYIVETLFGYGIKHVPGERLCILRSFMKWDWLRAFYSIFKRNVWYNKETRYRIYDGEFIHTILIILLSISQGNTIVLRGNLDKWWKIDISSSSYNFKVSLYFPERLPPHTLCKRKQIRKTINAKREKIYFIQI